MKNMEYTVYTNNDFLSEWQIKTCLLFKVPQ